MRLAYRADIDGLRGIAVLSVLLYHAGFASFSGGYVGVDVFFVISGFLITRVILDEIADGTFSLSRFYERRVRRIFPALFVTLALSGAAGAFVLTPANLKAMGESAVAVTLFVSNLLFWRQSGYFDATSAGKPLLHTWSLAVEEQFYIVYPMLLVTIRRFGRSRFALWLSVCALISLALDAYATYSTPVAAFYLAPLRAWELMLGAIVASGALPKLSVPLTRSVVAWTGLMLVAYCVLRFSATTAFPGIAALGPTLGAAMLIYAGTTGGALATRLLAARPLVFVGVISYSLYLLHWPLIVFTKYVLIRDTSVAVPIALAVTAIALSILSWRFVEQPLRRIRLPRRGIFGFAGAAMCAAVALGAFVDIRDGMPQRFRYAESRSRTCDDRRPEDPIGMCTIGPTVPPTFLLWGDSHAAALAPGMGTAAVRQRAGGYLATKSGCPPLIGVDVHWHAVSGLTSCAAFDDDIFRYVTAHPELHEIILAARWSMFAEGHGYLDDRDSTVTLTAGENATDGKWSNRDLFSFGLARTVERLTQMGREVAVIEPVPEVGYNVPEALYIAERTGRDVNRIIGPTIAEYEVRNRAVLDAIKAIPKSADLRIIDVAGRMCARSRCTVAASGLPLYQDDQHLSTFGAQFLSPMFDELLKKSTGPAHRLTTHS